MSQTVDRTSPVTFHTSVDKPFLLYRPCKAGKLSWPGWLVTHHEGHPMHQWLPTQGSMWLIWDRCTTMVPTWHHTTIIMTKTLNYFNEVICVSVSFSLARNFLIVLLFCNCFFDNFSPRIKHDNIHFICLFTATTRINWSLKQPSPRRTGLSQPQTEKSPITHCHWYTHHLRYQWIL